MVESCSREDPAFGPGFARHIPPYAVPEIDIVMKSLSMVFRNMTKRC